MLQVATLAGRLVCIRTDNLSSLIDSLVHDRDSELARVRAEFDRQIAVLREADKIAVAHYAKPKASPATHTSLFKLAQAVLHENGVVNQAALIRSAINSLSGHFTIHDVRKAMESIDPAGSLKVARVAVSSYLSKGGKKGKLRLVTPGRGKQAGVYEKPIKPTV